MTGLRVTNIPGWLRNAPLLTWAAVYFLTCVIGALLILWGYRPFILLFQYFSGVVLELPTDDGTLATLYALLFGAPLLTWAGYSLGWKLGALRLRQDDGNVAFLGLGHRASRSRLAGPPCW